MTEYERALSRWESEGGAPRPPARTPDIIWRTSQNPPRDRQPESKPH